MYVVSLVALRVSGERPMYRLLSAPGEVGLVGVAEPLEGCCGRGPIVCGGNTEGGRQAEREGRTGMMNRAASREDASHNQGPLFYRHKETRLWLSPTSLPQPALGATGNTPGMCWGPPEPQPSGAGTRPHRRWRPLTCGPFLAGRSWWSQGPGTHRPSPGCPPGGECRPPGR